MENPYLREPLQVILYDVPTGRPVRSYMLLGSVPQSVLEAANRGSAKIAAGRLVEGSKGLQMSWNAKDSTLLENRYGKHWRNLLTPKTAGLEVPDCRDVIGGAEIEFGDLDDFDRPDLLIAEGAVDDQPQSLTMEPPRQAPIETPPDWDPRTVYVNVSVYPEDTLEELKAKITAATGIPLYRQHIFYDRGPEDDAPARTTYRMTLEGGIVVTDIRELSREICGEKNTVAGLPVDRPLEEHKELVRIEALGPFRLLEEAPGALVRRVVVADLATVFRGRAVSIQKAIADKYQFDLLYYGLIIKYWPILSQEAFRLAIVNPAMMTEAFPLLDVPIEKIHKRLIAEREIIDGVYSQTKAQKQRLEREQDRGGVAVTETSLTVRPRTAKTLVNIRNIFDWIPVSGAIPAAIARLRADAISSRAADSYGRRSYVLTKTHVTAANPSVAAVLGRFLSRPPRRPGIVYAITRAKSESRRAGTSQSFVFLTLYETGEYVLESSWREDDRVGFKEIIRQLSAAVSPLVDIVNAMGPAGLPLGGRLETPMQASKSISGRAALGSMVVSVFWPHALTSEGFRDMKSRWREYEKAGIVGIKGLQQAGAYTFQFRKGMVNYEPRAIERAVFLRGDGGELAPNNYMYLTDPGLAQRWNRVYGGRLVRIYHRTTDLRIEIVGVDMSEFARVRLYVFNFLDKLVYGPDRLSRGIIAPGETRTPEGRLKSLQERDPNLFDLKKYDETATVYSVLCQGDRQPELLSEEEFKALPASRKSRLVQYWNFTEDRPAYYRCGSKRFPHLSFRVGEHPLGYCLPCCKKTSPVPGSKVLAYNELCAKHHQLSEGEITSVGEDSLAASRHVLSYGKPVAPGRVSDVPQILSGGLFYNTLAAPFEYRLVGVTQEAATLRSAGLFYSVASMLQIEPADLAQELADVVPMFEESYRGLANGGGGVFGSARELADAVRVTFSGRGGVFLSPFGPGGIAETVWKPILLDLVHLVYDILVVEFADERGDGDVVFVASPAAAAKIRKDRPDEEPISVGIVVSLPSGTYPFAAVNQREFSRQKSTFRQVFYSHSAGRPADAVFDVIRDMIAKRHESIDVSNSRFDLDFVTDVCTRARLPVVHRMINIRDMCYGVIINASPGTGVYFPVVYSPHYTPATTSVTAVHGPRPAGNYPAAALAEVFTKINAAASKIKPRQQLRPIARLVNQDGATTGFIAETIVGKSVELAIDGAMMYFHHDPTSNLAGLPWEHSPPTPAPYDMRSIDKAIYESGGLPDPSPLPAEKQALAAAGNYRYHLYDLFLAEFAALLRDERNSAIRDKLTAVIRQTQFGSPASVAALRASLRAILVGYPEDYDRIRELVASTYVKVGPKLSNIAVLEEFGATTYEFDHTTLARLRDLGDPNKIAVELSAMLSPLITIAENPAEIGNIYVACGLPSDTIRPQCAEGRLRMTRANFDTCIGILSADILNPLKTTTLGTLSAGIINSAKFTTRPGERITIS